MVLHIILRRDFAPTFSPRGTLLQKGLSVAEARSRRQSTMVAALVELKIGSAGTDFHHKPLIPSDRECIPDLEKYIYGHRITNIGYDMAIAVLLGGY